MNLNNMSPEELQALLDQLGIAPDAPEPTSAQTPAPAAAPAPAPAPTAVAPPNLTPANVGQHAFTTLDIARDAALRPDFWKQLGWNGGATYAPGDSGGGEERRDSPDVINPEFEKFLADNGLSSGYDLNGENVTRYLAKNGQLIDTQHDTTGVDHGAFMTYGPLLLSLAAGGAAAPYISAAAGGGLLGGAAAGAFSGAASAIGSGQQDLSKILGSAGVGALGGAAIGGLGSETPKLSDVPTQADSGLGSTSYGLGNASLGDGSTVLGGGGTGAGLSAYPGSGLNLAGSAPGMVGTAGSGLVIPASEFASGIGSSLAGLDGLAPNYSLTSGAMEGIKPGATTGFQATSTPSNIGLTAPAAGGGTLTQYGVIPADATPSLGTGGLTNAGQSAAQAAADKAASVANVSPIQQAINSLKNFAGPITDWAAANPTLAKLIFAGAGGLLAASSKPTTKAPAGYTYNGPMPTISRGGWQASVAPKTSGAPQIGLLNLPTTGQRNDGLWRYGLLGG